MKTILDILGLIGVWALVLNFDHRPKRARPGRLPCPLKTCIVTSAFSASRPHPVLRGTTRKHDGTDYACRVGDPVYSVGKGTVVRVDKTPGYGLLMEIEYPEYGKAHLRIAHLDRAYYKVGSLVSEGQIISTCGRSGVVSGSHLHAEWILPDGTKIDIDKLIRGKTKLAGMASVRPQKTGS